MNSPARWIALAVLVVGLVGGVYLWGRNLDKPQNGRMEQVDDEAAGGRTQAELPAGGRASTIPVGELGDPLQPGIPEKPDIPPDHAHMGIPTIGERIRDAVEADGKIGDTEVPGVDLAGLTQSQRKWFLDQAVQIKCTCGCDEDLLECRRDDAHCPTSPGVADSLIAVAKTH